MKEYQNFLMASLLLVGAIACTKDAIPSPLSSVTVKDGDKEVVAEIDHTAKTVKFDKFAEIDDFAAVKVNIAVANGASLVSPAADAVVDFTKQPVEIVVNDAVNDVIYSMTAKKPDPFKGVKVGGKPASVEGINITLPYDKETMDITRLKLDIALRKGANVVKPAEAVFDFSVKTTQGLTISYLGKDYIYQVRLEGYDPDSNPLVKAGWRSANDFYGSLPKHITIYKNEKLGKTKDQTGFLAEIGKGGKMLALGNGNSAYKSINEVAELPEAKDYPVIVNGISGINQAIISDGGFVYSSGSTFPCLAQEEDGTFVLCLQAREPLPAAPWWKSSLFMLDIDGTTKLKEGWVPKNLIGGYYMVMANGKAMTAAEMGKTGLYNNWFDGDAVHSREFIGLKKDGTVYVFVCGRGKDGNGGLAMKEVVDIMILAGCDRAMTLEGSTSANMLINGKKTDEYNDGTKQMKAIICFR